MTPQSKENSFQMMKNARTYLLPISLLAVGLGGCQAKKDKEYPYLIKLTLAGCPDNTSALVTLDMEAKGAAVLDTARMENGQLTFRGAVHHPGVYKIYCPCVAKKIATIINIYLPADSVQIAIDTNQNLLPAIYQKPGLGAYDVGSYLRSARVFSTARQQQEVAFYLRTRDSLWNKFFLDKAAMAAKMNNAIGAGNKPEIDRWADSTRRVQESFPSYLVAASEQFIKRHPRSEVNLFAMLDAGDARVARQRLLPYYQAMPDSVRTSYYGQVLAKRYGT
jgi:hypothetical protein